MAKVSLYQTTDKGIVWMMVTKNGGRFFWKKMGGPITYYGDGSFTPYESHNGVDIKGLLWTYKAYPIGAVGAATITAVKGNTTFSLSLDTGNLYTIRN